MTIPSTSKNLSRWQRIRPYLTSAPWWFRWLSVVLFVCIAFGMLLGRYYFFELFSHFQIQYWLALIGLLVFGVLDWVIARKRVQVWLVLPSLSLLLLSPNTNGLQWLPGDYDEPAKPSASDVRVYHANVLVDRREYETTVTQLRSQRPDLFVLQEMTPASIRIVTGQLRSDFPHWFACWSKKVCWTLVGSRTPIRTDVQLAKTRQIIHATTRVRGQTLSLLTVHPRVPLLPSWFHQRNTQLTEVARRTRTSPVPTVLIGDFNISVFSPIYSDLLSPFGRVPNRRAPPLHSGRQKMTQPTWPNCLPALFMIPIDHAFVNNGFNIKQFRTLGQVGSDHRALVVDLNFSTRANREILRGQAFGK